MLKKRAPPKLARFMVWTAASKDNREDIVVAFDEMYERTVEKFGVSYGYVYAWQQAARSFPYGAAALTLKIVSFFAKNGS